MAKRRAVIEGMDYVPIAGCDPNIVFGVLRSTLAGATNSLTESVRRRLFPVPGGGESADGWANPTAYRFDVTLPLWAPPAFKDPFVLCSAYEAQAWSGLKDLAVMMNFRFPECTASPPALTLQGAFELTRGFAYQRLSLARQMATIVVQHVPSHAGRSSHAHVHVIGLARAAGPLGFGEFIRDLATDNGREIIEAEFSGWRSTHG